VALLLSLRRRQGAAPNADQPSASFPHRLTPLTLLTWGVWIGITALVYSLVDWRMTKHLSPLFIPLFLIPAAWSSSGWVARTVVLLTFSALFVWNLTVMRMVRMDFHLLTITPAW
jgi:hypothetical protein